MPFPESFFRRSPGVPRLAHCLRTLAAEIDAQWPDRETSHDGWIGDRAHASRVSDHNPDRRGVVHALDVTSAGIDPSALVTWAITHPATAYVIFDGQIWSPPRRLSPSVYTGSNPHSQHLHIACRYTRRAERSDLRWLG